MPAREQLPEAEQERLVEAVTQHRIRRLEEQSDVGEAGPLLRETLRAEVEDWMPVLLSHLAAALSDQEGKLLVSSLRWATEFIARKKIAPPENPEEVDWLEYVAALDLLKDAALASTPDQDGGCERCGGSGRLPVAAVQIGHIVDHREGETKPCPDCQPRADQDGTCGGTKVVEVVTAAGGRVMVDCKGCPDCQPRADQCRCIQSMQGCPVHDPRADQGEKPNNRRQIIERLRGRAEIESNFNLARELDQAADLIERDGADGETREERDCRVDRFLKQPAVKFPAEDGEVVVRQDEAVEALAAYLYWERAAPTEPEFTEATNAERERWIKRATKLLRAALNQEED